MIYGHFFNTHVIDYYLWLALHHRDGKLRALCAMGDRGYRFAPDDWSRYDGELL